MFTPREDENRRLLRARDAIDRSYSDDLDVATLARIALISPSHFIRRFRAVFGETPHRYLQRRRIERACALLRTTDTPVLDIAAAVGYDSPGTFGRTFTRIVGCSPTAYRGRVSPLPVPGCFVRRWTRPVDGPSEAVEDSDFGEAWACPRVVSSSP
jgi:AraC-like DNA-binding protein